MGEHAGAETPKKQRKGAFNIYADLDMRDHVNQMRAAGRTFGGRLISHGLLYELAYNIVQGMVAGEGEEMVLLQQSGEELKAEEAALAQKRKMWEENVERARLKKVAREAEQEREWEDVRVLAARIVELWDKIILEHRWNLIDSLVAISPERLRADEVRAVFPVNTYQPAPDPSRAFQIAAGLLHYENAGGMTAEA